jgi:PAS domain-containing protein
MQSFVLQQNVERFRRMLADQTLDERSRAMVRALLISAQRDLALVDSQSAGAYTGHVRAAQARIFGNDAAQDASEFLADFRTTRKPYILLDPGPSLPIVDVNDAYAAVTMIEREAVIGKGLFEIFPDNPEDSSADGMNNLLASLRIVAETGQAHVMAIQRYDVRDEDGRFIERYWQPVNTPIFDSDGHLRFILHYVEDVTEEMISSKKVKSGSA